MTANDLGIVQLNSGKAPHKNMQMSYQPNSKKPMNQNDYKKSMKYIENFYQKNQSNPQSHQQSNNSNVPNEANDSGFLFDDLPKSVTEESSLEAGEDKDDLMMNSRHNQGNRISTNSNKLPRKLFKEERADKKSKDKRADFEDVQLENEGKGEQ